MTSKSYHHYHYYYNNIIIIIIASLLSMSNVKSIPENYYENSQHTLGIIEDKGFKGNFLHLTDIHLDPYYLPHSDPALYCHRYSENQDYNEAGLFGTLKSDCDTPYDLIDSAFKHFKDHLQNDIDFVIYTGDSLRHDRDPFLGVTERNVTWGHRTTVEYFKNHFDLSKIKIIPTIGNNDVWEHNQLSAGPNDFFRNLTKIWAPLNLNLTKEYFIDGGGYYRQDIGPKLTTLNLNSMYFYESNNEIKDCHVKDSPGHKQLKWLETELIDAKYQERNVYISQHIAPLDSSGKLAYYPSCYRYYVKLLGKYSDVIAGHFTGHTNQDTIALVTESVNSQDKYDLFILNGKQQPPTRLDDTVLVLNNAPSIIPVNNPAFRVYSYSASPANFGILLDYAQYYTNLTESSENEKIEWEVEYIASEVYNITKLRTEDWIKVLDEFRKPNSILWEKYVKYINVSLDKKKKKKKND